MNSAHQYFTGIISITIGIGIGVDINIGTDGNAGR